MNIKTVGHRANTLRRMKYYKKHRVDYIEIDLTQVENKVVLYHGEDLTSSVSRKEWILKQLLSKLQGRDRLLFKPMSFQQALDNADRIFENPGVWIDLKNVRNANLMCLLLKNAVEKLKNHVTNKPIIVSGNNISLMRELNQTCTTRKTNVKLAINILYTNTGINFITNLLELTGAQIVSFNTDTFNNDLARMIKELGLKTALWTVNSPSYLARYRNNDLSEILDYVITDRPDLLKKSLPYMHTIK